MTEYMLPLFMRRGLHLCYSARECASREATTLEATCSLFLAGYSAVLNYTQYNGIPTNI